MIKKAKLPKRSAAKKNNTSTRLKNKKVRGSLLLEAGGQKNVDLLVNRRLLHFTNLDKIYFPDERISKRDVLNYYDRISPYILPYLKNRPQSLNRHPNGINGPNFYQKNVDGKVADWLKTYMYHSDSNNRELRFLVCKDAATLLYMANLGCIEMNPWHSRIQRPDHPDWCVIDLDPDGNPFSEVMEVARMVNSILTQVSVKSYCKTSGATGMHIFIPMGAHYTYDQSRMLAELIVGIVHREMPSLTSLERNPAKRKKKIYLDYLQNRTIQTIASAYSLRPKPGATISAPLLWDELKKNLTPQKFNIKNMISRVNEMGDIFKPVLGKGINLKSVIRKMGAVIEN